MSPAARMKTVPIVEGGRPKANLIGAAIIVAFAAVAAFGGYKLLTRTPMPDTRNITIRPLTDHKEVASGIAAVSPDGRLMAYVRREGERSLRVKQVARRKRGYGRTRAARFFRRRSYFYPGRQLSVL